MKTILFLVLFVFSISAHAERSNEEITTAAVFAALDLAFSDGAVLYGEAEGFFASTLEATELSAKLKKCLAREFNKKVSSYDQEVHDAYSYFGELRSLKANLEEYLKLTAKFAKDPKTPAKSKLILGLHSIDVGKEDMLRALARRQKIDDIANHLSSTCEIEESKQ